MTFEADSRVEPMEQQPAPTSTGVDGFAFGTFWGIVRKLPDGTRQRVEDTVNHILDSYEMHPDEALIVLETARPGSILELDRRIQEFGLMTIESYVQAHD